MAMQSQHGLLHCRGEWEAEQGKRERLASKRGEASYLFIILDKATLFVAAARSRMGCERMMCETELCETGRNRTMREIEANIW